MLKILQERFKNQNSASELKALTWVNIRRITVLFFHTALFRNTALHTENIAWLVTCMAKSSHNEEFVDQKYQLKHCHTQKYHLGMGLEPNAALGFASCYVY